MKIIKKFEGTGANTLGMDWKITAFKIENEIAWRYLVILNDKLYIVDTIECSNCVFRTGIISCGVSSYQACISDKLKSLYSWYPSHIEYLDRRTKMMMMMSMCVVKYILKLTRDENREGN